MSAGDRKTYRQICRCEHCGNEAEMLVSCSLEEVEARNDEDNAPAPSENQRVKGTATCSQCGNEADMWVDL